MTTMMTTKATAIHTIEELPENATWDDVQERINYRIKANSELIEIARVWHAARGIPEL